MSGAESNSSVVKNGTLHGRVFNPLFILIMIKHIFDQIPKHIQIAAFADDTVIRKRGRSVQTIKKQPQEAFKQVQIWTTT